ncbi:MAG: hypothetical protein AB1762_03975 [Gemmatimonadota bacterium]
MTWHSLGILVAVVGNSAAAQPPQVIGGSQLCASCRIARERLTILDRAAVDGSSEVKAVSISPQGEYWVTVYVGGPETLLRRFAADGRFIATVGRKGQGPLEFMAATLLLRTRADTLLVFDPHVGRVTVVDPHLKYVRSVADRRLARAPWGITLPDGRVVTSGALRTGDGIGQPLHLYDDSLRYLKSFGALPERVHRPSDDAKLVRVFGAAPDGFWVAHADEYVMEKWSAQLTRTEVLQREAPWFVATSATEDDPPRPKPLVLSVQQYGDYLWTLVAVPDRDWKRALGKRFEVQGRPRYVIDDANDYYDSIIEVVDLRTRRVVNSQRFDELFVGIFGHQLTGGEVTDKDGSPSFTIWQLRLDRGTRRTNVR